MTPRSPRDLVDGSETLSSVSVVYERLNEVLFSKRTTIAQISSIIMQDAGLSARLLRIVNSAYFGFPRSIDTISRAVMVVGTQQLNDLALATSIVNQFRRMPDCFVSMESFWKHSVACGLAARVIAGLHRESNVEKFFVAGILHDVGRLVLYGKVPDLAEKVFLLIVEHPEPMFKAEQAVIGFDHASVGGALIESWRLPASLEEGVRYHHNPSLAARYPLEASIVHVADIIAHAMQIGSSGEPSVPPIDGRAWDLVGLKPEFLPQVFDLVERQLEGVLRMFVSD